MLSDVLPALLAVVLWAISAPVINAGLGRLRQARQARQDRQDRGLLILLALTVCLTAGFVVCWTVSGFATPLAALDNKGIAAVGLLIFPIGTGLYYLCSLAYGDRAEVASQFANVKPAISILAGVWLFHERFGVHEAVVAGIIGLGIVVILSGALRRNRQMAGVGLGLALAVAWAGGEITARSVTGGVSSIHITLGALFSALIVTATVTLIYVLVRGGRRALKGLKYHYFLPFLMHGIISFGLAYMFFFESLARIGLSQTILLTVFWPMLALGLNLVLSRLRGKAYRVPANVLIASLLFTLASVTHLLWRI